MQRHPVQCSAARWLAASPLAPSPCRAGVLRCAVQEHVIGQEEAIGSTARAMVRAQSGLKDPARPIAALMFAGPTGVGKTELAKVRSMHGAAGEGGKVGKRAGSAPRQQLAGRRLCRLLRAGPAG